jgi:hypothetical protein
MAIPTRTQTLNTFVAATQESRRPGLIDNFFKSAPTVIRMRSKHAVRLRGGEIIKVQHIYQNFDASSYGRGTEFSTEVKEFATSMVFNWKFAYAPVNLDTIDVDLNDSPEQVFDLVDAALEVGELSLINDLGEQLFGDGTGNSSLDFDGLANAVSTSGSYGGITRGADAQGSSIKAAFEDATGGTLSLALMNSNFGSAVVARKKPDLIPTTQTLWNRIWERSQPSEQNNGGDDLREIGLDTVRFNGADVVVDSHCPSGFMYFLNTDYWEFYVHQKWDFRFRGFMEPTNQQRQIGQQIVWGNFVCRGPRFQGVMSGLS